MKKLITIILILFMPILVSAVEWDSHIDIREAGNWDVIGYRSVPNSPFIEVTLAEENVKVAQVFIEKYSYKIIGYRYLFGEELYIWTKMKVSGEFLSLFAEKEKAEAIKNKLKSYIKRKDIIRNV